ncbi:MAG TPA: hypothetical protein VFQ53_24795 [Kofleriaceae bacterium]|nr:hypothetical protein [Kofleriaceae bacterium]
MKQIDPDLLALIAETHGHAELEWTRSIPIPGDPDFPVFQLPEGKLVYAKDRGYPVKLAARRVADRDRPPVLVVQLESFELAHHDEAGWAIPTKYTPQTDEERIAQALGFDEGWEDARVECIFLCDARFHVFWRAARDRKRFGLTAAGADSLYPVPLGKRELDELDRILKQWPRPEER